MSAPNRTGTILITLLGGIAVILGITIFWESFRKPETQPPLSVSSRTTLPTAPDQEPTPEWTFIPSTPAPERSLKDSENRLAKRLNDEGLALYAQGHFEAAAERFEEALAQNPSDPVLKNNFANAIGSQAWQMIESDQLAEALLQFQRAVDLKPEEAAFYMGMGLTHYRLNEEESALDMLKTAILYRSDDPQPYILLGEIYYGRDELDLAVGYFEKATELAPNDQGLENRLGKALRDQKTQGDFQQQATRHFTVKFEGHEEISVAREVTNLLEEAYRQIGQSLSAFPQTPITVILYSEQQFRDVTLSPGWSKGIFDGKIRIPIEGIQSDQTLLEKIVNHEYTHALIYDLSKTPIPTWLNEGIALNLEGMGADPWENIIRIHTQRGGKLIPLKNLHGSFLSFSDRRASLAYAESYSATRYLIDRYSLYKIRELILDMANGSTFERAFEDRLMVPYERFENNWRSQVE